ncbi:Nif3-like dinuclear metal center hexameric protein [Bacteriovoracaceae bacterium]|nr:Nif3-like dinuclear metal center hexameric protein [Bacteriovoracaceae bacterium]
MSIKRNELTKHLNNLLNIYEYSDYGPNGLQVEGKTEIKKIAFSVSATVDSINQASAWGADALIVHHGIFWKHQSARTITGPHANRIKPLIQNDINLYGYHLPLDAHTTLGNAAGMANSIGLSELAPFGEYKNSYLGLKGKFSPSIRARELKERIEKALNKTITLASPDDSQLISTMGIITGGANNEWPKALKDKLDSYLTGEISEYNWHDAIEAGLHYFACGHHATERFGVMSLDTHLKNKFGVETKFIDSNNPV